MVTFAIKRKRPTCRDLPKLREQERAGETCEAHRTNGLQRRALSFRLSGSVLCTVLITSDCFLPPTFLLFYLLQFSLVFRSVRYSRINSHDFCLECRCNAQHHLCWFFLRAHFQHHSLQPKLGLCLTSHCYRERHLFVVACNSASLRQFCSVLSEKVSSPEVVLFFLSGRQKKLY